MNTRLLLICAASTLVVAGCTDSTISDERHAAYVKPGLIMLTADQAEHRGIAVRGPKSGATPAPADLEPLDAAAVIVPPDIKVYTLNRAVDPADPELMHEEHVVYRRETTPAWRLQAPAGQKILVGPRVTDGRQELQPLLDKELTGFLSDERRATEANQKAIAALFKAVDALNRQHEALARQLGRTAPDSSEPATNGEKPADSGKSAQP